jgi:hypothetical protein
MKARPCKPPFQNYVGYYQTLDNGRTYIYMWDRKTDKRRLVSLARYRLSVSLGRELRKHEEADHKDDDKTNDRLSNLQVLVRRTNQQKEQIRRRGFLQTKTPQYCQTCGTKMFHVKPRLSCSLECKRALLADGRCVANDKRSSVRF